MPKHVRIETNRLLVAAMHGIFGVESGMREDDQGKAEKCAEDLRKAAEAVERNVKLMVQAHDFDM